MLSRSATSRSTVRARRKDAKSKRLLQTALAAAILAAALTAGPAARAADVSLDLPVVSQYVWRGIQANKEAVLQPSLTVSGASGLSFNLWGNLDLTGYGAEAGYGNRSGEFTELDLTLDYSRSFGPMGASVGIISYVFPGVGSTTHELYAKVTASVIASPFVAVYSDVDEIKGTYFQAGVSHSFTFENAGPLSGIDLGVTLGYGSGTYNLGYFGFDKAAPVDLVASLGVPLAFGGVTLTPSAAYSYLLDSEIRDAAGETGYAIFALSLGLTL